MVVPTLSPRPVPLPANNFDFLRFFFASLVVFSHSSPVSSGNELREPLMLATGGQLTFGSIAVDCFFIISGFLILHSWRAQPDPARFLTKRILRIYPAFLLVAVLDAFVVAPMFSTTGYQTVDAAFVKRFVLNALRLLPETPGSAFPTNPAPGPVNGSLWSISYEFWCYVGILVLGVAGRASARKALIWGLAVALGVAFIFQWQHLTPGGRWLGQILGYPPFWARLLPFFMVGMAFHAFRDRISLTWLGASAALAALVVARWIPYGLLFVLPLAGAYLVFWFAFLSLPHLQRFADRGDYSYGIYLYSFPLLQIVTACTGGRLAPWSLFLIGWPLSILAATASWHLLEKHCVRLAKGRRLAVTGHGVVRPT